MIHKVIFDCEVDFDHKYIRGFSMDHAWFGFNNDAYLEKISKSNLE
jgi:hypothetical protein